MTPDSEQIERLAEVVNIIINGLFEQANLSLPEIGTVLNIAVGKFIASVSNSDEMLEAGLKVSQKNIEQIAHFYYKKFKEEEEKK
jgi:hypothetical protein